MAPALAPAPAASSATSATSTCSVVIGGVDTPYATCFEVTGVGSNYYLAWNLDTDTTDPTMSVLSMALNATSDGFVAVGFPQNPGQMLGSSAMILQACSSCPSGAKISQYSLGGYIPSLVTPSNSLNATDLEASSQGGILAGKFTVKLPSRGRKRRLLDAPLRAASSSFPIIFSAGELTSSGGLQQHSTQGSSSIDLTSALNANPATAPPGSDNPTVQPAPVIVVTPTENQKARTAHMWLMAIGFGVLIPLGILVAHWWPPPTNKKGFQVHRAVQTLGFAVGCGGIAAAFVAVGSWYTVYTAHRDIGITVIVLTFVQVLSIVWRPAVDSKIRRPWRLGHRWLGTATAVLAIANIYYGIVHVARLGTWAWATYTAILGLIFIAAVSKEVSDCITPPTGVATDLEKNGESSSRSGSGPAYMETSQGAS